MVEHLLTALGSISHLQFGERAACPMFEEPWGSDCTGKMAVGFVVKTIESLGEELCTCLGTARYFVTQGVVVLLLDQWLESRMKAERYCRDFGDGKGPRSPIVLAECSSAAVVAVAKRPGGSVADIDWTSWSLIVGVVLVEADASEEGEGVVLVEASRRSHPRLNRPAQVESSTDDDVLR